MSEARRVGSQDRICVAGTALLLGGLVAVVLGKVKLVVIAVVTLVIVVRELRRPRAA